MDPSVLCRRRRHRCCPFFMAQQTSNKTRLEIVLLQRTPEEEGKQASRYFPISILSLSMAQSYVNVFMALDHKK